MSFEACAAIVERADPDRFLATMAASVAARRVLFPIYAFNVEVSRAPWVTEEPMIAEMRLQWWRDALEEIATGGDVRRHEVVDALAEVLDAEAARTLDGLVAARRWDVYKDPFEDQTHFEEYINATSGDLLWTAVRLCGAGQAPDAQAPWPQPLEASVKQFGFGVGVASWFRAIPELEARGRVPLVSGTVEGVKLQAQAALRDLQTARSVLRKEGRADAALADVLRVGWRADHTLKTAATTPMAVADGALDESPFRRRASLLWCTWRQTF